MKVVLRGIINEIEAAQQSARLAGRSVDYVLLTPDEASEFKYDYGKRCPEDEDEMFKAETFWKGVRIKTYEGEAK